MPFSNEQGWQCFARFADLISDAKSADDLHCPLENIVHQFGFSWFALVKAPCLEKELTRASSLSNYPDAWQSEIVEDRLYLDDPAHTASELAENGVSWDQIEQRIVLSEHQKSTLMRAKHHGLRTGFTLQLRYPKKAVVIFSVAREEAQPLHRHQILSARLIATAVHEHANRLLLGSPEGSAKVHLSPRQIDCLTLAAQGRTNLEIAVILDISHNTVHEYIEDACRRYHVRKRVQLVLRAIEDGYLSLHDAVRH